MPAILTFNISADISIFSITDSRHGACSPSVSGNLQRTTIILITTLVLFGLANANFDLYSSDIDIINYDIKVTNKIAGQKVVGKDTVIILTKSSASKYVDSTRLDRLDRKVEYNFIFPDSLSDGSYGVFYNDKKQNLAFIIRYKRGQRNGDFRSFFFDGKIKSTGFYLDNCHDKVSVDYYSNGQLNKIKTWSKCRLQGQLYEFYESGRLFRTATYADGKLHGRYLEFDYDNQGVCRTRYDFLYDNGERTEANYH